MEWKLSGSLGAGLVMGVVVLGCALESQNLGRPGEETEGYTQSRGRKDFIANNPHLGACFTAAVWRAACGDHLPSQKDNPAGPLLARALSPWACSPVEHEGAVMLTHSPWE